MRYPTCFHMLIEPPVGSALRAIGVASIVTLMTLVPMDLSAQGRGNSRGGSAPTMVVPRPGSTVVLSVDQRSFIRDFYAERPRSEISSLPPGIRRNLARGKPLPPGIAKRFAPAALTRGVRLPQGYQLMEIGSDLLLVEVATNLIHDVLLDAIR